MQLYFGKNHVISKISILAIPFCYRRKYTYLFISTIVRILHALNFSQLVNYRLFSLAKFYRNSLHRSSLHLQIC